MALPDYSMRQLLEAGVHFGHHTRRWNPKMSPYIYGVRNGIHVIDLEQTVPLLRQGLEAIREVVAGGGRVLLVGTKRQAQEAIAEAAKRCGQYYVNYRWLGGMLTNFKTISQSIKRLRELDERITTEESGLTKRELLELTRDRDKLERALGGIKEMGGLPDIIVAIDTNQEAIAVSEANTLRIPVVAILDSNSSPDGIAYPIPGNDDAMRAIQLYCDLVSGALLDGLQAELAASGVDVGARPDLPEMAFGEQAVGDEEADGGLDGTQPREAEAAEAAGESGSRSEAVFPRSGRTAEAELTHMIATIGENLVLRRLQRLAIRKGAVFSYVHNVLGPGLGRIGVIVALASRADTDQLAGLGKQLAMHIAATSPLYLDIASVPQSALDRERGVLREQARATGKPDATIE